MRLLNKKLFCPEFYNYVEFIFDWNGIELKSHDWNIDN